MSEPCLELYVFTVRDRNKAAQARRAAQQFVQGYSGFLSWSAYSSLEDNRLFADMVLWQDAASARNASRRLKEDPHFAGLLEEIDGLITISQYRLDRQIEARASGAVAA